MNWVESFKAALPDYAKDTRLNLDAVLLRSSLDPMVAEGCALAAAVATGNGKIVGIMLGGMTNEQERDAAMTAASIMAQNNVWYPYNEMVDDAFKGMSPGLRMNAIATHGGTSKENFEAYSLAASIVGKCHFCVKSHFTTLKEAGYSLDQLKDIGRIASVINSVCKVLVG
jgi:alkyl hydroperoxide reductase subunit D